MAQNDICQDCNQRHRCREIYEKLGKIRGPSIAYKIVFAFLLPLIVFVVSLVCFEWLLATVFAVEQFKTVLVLFSALVAVAVDIVITKLINKRFNKNR